MIKSSLFRRRMEDTEVSNNKNNNDKSRNRRGGRLLYTPSRLLSRRFSRSSRTDDIIADDDISSCCKTAEDSSTGGISTKIHIQQGDHAPLNQIDENNEASDEGICDDIMSKLIDLLPCLPQQEHINDIFEKIQQKIPETNYDDEMMTQIECILRQAMNDDDEDGLSVPFPTNEDHINNDHKSCNSEDTTNKLSPPREWIQNLLLVSTPQSNMHIHRIRHISEPSYFDCPSDIPLDNNQVIQLPINNGKEVDSWVVDFETTIFEGTALFRIRGCDDRKSSSTESNDNAKYDYFERYNRRFQLIIRGRFKERIVIADCMSGLLLDHPLNSLAMASNMDCSDIAWHGESETNSSVVEPSTSDKRKRVSRRLKRGKSATSDSSPPKWVLRAAVKVAGVFSPRIDADLECSHPRILTPLCSTAQTITRHDNGLSPRLDGQQEEPCIDSDTSLVVDLCGLSPNKQNNNASNAQRRKRYSDVVYDARVESTDCSGRQTSAASPCFDTDAEYTFEFLQHLIDYNDLSLDLGSLVGKVKLGAALRGQPVRFVSAVKQRGSSESKELKLKDIDCLWSFDLWHKSLLP